MRGGARTSVNPGLSRPSMGARPSMGGGRPIQPSVASPSRGSIGGGNIAGANRPTQLPSNAGRTSISGGEVVSGGRGNNLGTGNRNNVGTGNRNTVGNGNRNNINTGNRNNINIDRDGIRNINTDVDRGWYPGYGYGYGYGAAAAAGAIVGAAIGSTIYALPPSCVSSVYTGYTYYHCGDVWYQAQYQGDDVVYVVVEQP